MPRGGYRTGAGGKSTWRYGKTKTIRVPEALAERILEIAREIDEVGDQVTSKTLDLTGIAILQSPRGPVVRLVDLLKAGYDIKPERIVKSLKPQVEGDLKRKGDLESFIEEFL